MARRMGPPSESESEPERASERAWGAEGSPRDKLRMPLGRAVHDPNAARRGAVRHGTHYGTQA